MYFEKKAGPQLAGSIYKSNSTGDTKTDAQNIVYELLDHGLMPSRLKVNEAGFDYDKCKLAYEDYYNWLKSGDR